MRAGTEAEGTADTCACWPAAGVALWLDGGRLVGAADRLAAGDLALFATSEEGDAASPTTGPAVAGGVGWTLPKLALSF